MFEHFETQAYVSAT